MSLAEMQACLARLYVDDLFRKLFYIDLTGTLQAYKLSTDEVYALQNIDRNILEFFAFSLKDKCKQQLVSAYPLLFTLNTAEINRYFERYYQLYPSRPNTSRFSHIIEFGLFMEQSLAYDVDFPPYASDLAHYERLNYYTIFHPLSSTFKRTSSENEHPDPATVTLASLPRTCPSLQLEMFSYNMVKIVNALQRHQRPDELHQGLYCLAFQHVAYAHPPNIFNISPTTKMLLDLCDGTRTVGALIAAMEQTLGKTDLQDEILQIICHMVTYSIIGV